MKKIFAVFMLVVYLGVIISSFVNAHQSFHEAVCGESSENFLVNQPSENEQNCCNYTFLQQRFQHHSHNAGSFYNLKIPVVNFTASKISALLQTEVPVKFNLTPATILACPDIYLKNRILLI